MPDLTVAGAAARAAASAAAVCIYYVLGGDCLTERVTRWPASCKLDRGSRMGKLERPNAGQTRKNIYFGFGN